MEMTKDQLIEKEELCKIISQYLTRIRKTENKCQKIELVIKLYLYINDQYNISKSIYNHINLLNFRISCEKKLLEFHKENEQKLLQTIQINNNFYYKTPCLHFTKKGNLCSKNQYKNGYCKQHFKINQLYKTQLEKKKIIYTEIKSPE